MRRALARPERAFSLCVQLKSCTQVCDEKARLLTNEQRSAVAEFFAVSKGNDQGGKKVQAALHRWQKRHRLTPLATPGSQVNLSNPLHPSLQRAYDEVLLDAWVNVRAFRSRVHTSGFAEGLTLHCAGHSAGAGSAGEARAAGQLAGHDPGRGSAPDALGAVQGESTGPTRLICD